MLQHADCDLAALAYVRRMLRMNLMGRADPLAASPAGPSALAGLAGQSHLLNWADKTFGQGLTSLTKGAWPKAHTCTLDKHNKRHDCSWLFWSALQQVADASVCLHCTAPHGGERCTCGSKSEKSSV